MLLHECNNEEYLFVFMITMLSFFLVHLCRLSAAQKEMDYGATAGNFDIIIVNDELEKAYSSLRGFILPEIQQKE